MTGPIKLKNCALAFAIGTEGSNGALTETAVTVPVYDLSYELSLGLHARDPNRARLGHLGMVPGERYGIIRFGVDLRGSGTAGVAPKYGKLLRGCGMSETANTGSASIGSTVSDRKHANSTVTVLGASAVAGTFSGTKSGTLELVVTAVTTNTNVVFTWIFWPSDGSAADVTTTTHTSTSTQTPSGTTYIDGVTLATTVNPGSSTTGVVVGDRWTVALKSDQAVSVTYKDTSTSHSCLDMAFFGVDASGDYKQFKLHSARGTWSTSLQLGQPGRLAFEFMGVLNAATAIWADGSTWGTTGAYDATVSPAFLGVTSTVDGGGVQCFRTLGLDYGAEVVMRECAGQATGYKAADINAIRPTGTRDPEAVLVATDNPFGRVMAASQHTFLATIGSTAGNIITINVPNYQETGVTQAERNGTLVEQVAFQCAEPEYDAGDDYHQIDLVFT